MNAILVQKLDSLVIDLSTCSKNRTLDTLLRKVFDPKWFWLPYDFFRIRRRTSVGRSSSRNEAALLVLHAFLFANVRSFPSTTSSVALRFAPALVFSSTSLSSLMLESRIGGPQKGDCGGYTITKAVTPKEYQRSKSASSNKNFFD